MVKGSSTPSGASPATAGGSPIAESNSAGSGLIADMNVEATNSVRFEEDETEDHGEGSDEDDEEKEDVERVKSTAELLEEVDELSLQVGRMGNPRPVERNLAAELEDDADEEDEDQGVAQGERPPLLPKATRNTDTPSANKVLARLGEEMRTQSEWMMMFAPMAMAQAKWPILGPELTQPVNSTSINELVQDTVLLLRAMGYRCNGRPNSLILSSWELRRASMEITHWKRRLRIAFGLEKAPGAQPTIAKRVAEFDTDPSKIPLPKTPETKRVGKFRSTEGTPYFEDSHMMTPKHSKERSGRYEYLRDAGDEAELSDTEQEFKPSYDRRSGETEESAKDQIRRLSCDEADRGGAQYLEMRTHFSLDKVAEFDGKRFRSDASLQWLKRFIYEMKGTRMPQDSWCEPFSLCLGRAAKSWYRQLSKKTQGRWKLLSEAFLEYYCSQFDQSARTRYYSAKRKANEPIYDFLTRLNGYARTAKIQYEKGGADAVDHVERFLLNCGDDAIMDLLYPLQLTDISRVEQIINRKILGEKRKKQRDRLISTVSRDGKRNEPRRSDRRDGRHENRRDDRRSRRDESRDRRVVSAEASIDDLYTGADQRYSRGYGSSEEESEYSASEGSESDQSRDYVDAGQSSDRNRDSADRSGQTTRRHNSASRPSTPTGYENRRDDSRERPRYGPCAACGADGHSAHYCRKRCKFCKQVHEVGRCELFQRLEKLTKFVRTSVDKSTVPADLQDIFEPKPLN
jgi:hypothetical protein